MAMRERVSKPHTVCKRCQTEGRAERTGRVVEGEVAVIITFSELILAK